jgi:hypothetical protein
MMNVCFLPSSCAKLIHLINLLSCLLLFKVPDGSLMKLRIIFPENLIIAALDPINRGSRKPFTLLKFDFWKERISPDWFPFFLSVIRRSTPWRHTKYEVPGSTAMYTILLDMGFEVPYSCTLSFFHIRCCFVGNPYYGLFS